MAYDEELAQRIREKLEGEKGIVEKAMFGGLSFLLNGNMAVGVIKDEMVVRVDPEAFDELLAQPGARIFDFSGRPMQGWLLVGEQGVANDEDLSAWIQRGVSYAASLPPK